MLVTALLLALAITGDVPDQDADAQKIRDYWTCRAKQQTNCQRISTVYAKTDVQAGRVDEVSMNRGSPSRPVGGNGGSGRVTTVAPAPAPAPGIRHRPPPPPPSCRAVISGQVSSDDLMITFDKNSARLSCSMQANLRAFAAGVRDSDLRFAINGHTSHTGPAELNERLSQARAEAVVTFLSSPKGGRIARGRLEPRGWGFRQPLANTQGTEDANRRVEAEILPAR